MAKWVLPVLLGLLECCFMEIGNVMEDAIMPQPTPIPVRQAIYKQWQQDRSASEVAQSLNVAERTVRHLPQRFQEQGEHLRREHATWGSTMIQINLRKSQESDALPVPRTISR